MQALSQLRSLWHRLRMETLATAGDDASVVTALFLCGLLAVAGGVIALTNVCVQLKLVFVWPQRETAEAIEESDATEEEATRERTTRVGRPRGGMKVAARIGERLRREIGRGGRPEGGCRGCRVICDL